MDGGDGVFVDVGDGDSGGGDFPFQLANLNEHLVFIKSIITRDFIDYLINFLANILGNRAPHLKAII